ncbi:MAG: YihY/virulence factor BrkB family protein [Myxococcota bacterium]
MTASSVSWTSPETWLYLANRLRIEFEHDHVPLVAAGVAFFWLLALFPALATGVSIWAMVADPAEVLDSIGPYMSLLPGEAADLIEARLTRLTSAEERTSLTIGAVGAFLASVWAANTGVKGLVTGLNIAWDLPETRGFVANNLLGIGLLLLGFLVAALATGAFIALPIFEWLGYIGEAVKRALEIVRWPLLALAMATYLSWLYHFAPCRKRHRFAFLTPGAVMATAAFLIVSAGFSFYVGNIGGLSETYGSLVSIIVLLLWFWLTAMSILFGAEVDSELERLRFHGIKKDGRPNDTLPLHHTNA